MEDFKDEEVLNETANGQEAAGTASEAETKTPDSDPVYADQQKDTDAPKQTGPAGEDKTSGEAEKASGEEKEADDPAAADEDGGSAGDTGRKSFFGKKKKDKKDQQIEELMDRVQRQMAEFDNFRKRSEKEKAAMFEVGAKSVLEKILPTVDNFERGFANLTEEQKQDAFVQGMEKVYRQLLTSLEGIGVKPIEAVGQPFDPNFHNAVMHVEDEEAGENMVVEEFQKGYLYRDSVIRHSMVKVAN